MKAIRIVLSSLLLSISLLATGCANISAQKAPNAELTKLKTFYVVKLAPDGRGINHVISDQLNLMGYLSTTGGAAKPDIPVDAIVTYQDKWMWDITMYMLQLNIQVRDPATNMVWAKAQSYRPSLQRKSPESMSREVLESLLSAK